MACEKCWGDAFIRMWLSGYIKTQAECYVELLEECKDNPCTPEEQQRGDSNEKHND